MRTSLVGAMHCGVSGLFSGLHAFVNYYGIGELGFEFCVFVAGWRHALRSECPFIITGIAIIIIIIVEKNIREVFSYVIPKPESWVTLVQVRGWAATHPTPTPTPPSIWSQWVWQPPSLGWVAVVENSKCRIPSTDHMESHLDPGSRVQGPGSRVLLLVIKGLSECIGPVHPYRTHIRIGCDAICANCWPVYVFSSGSPPYIQGTCVCGIQWQAV